MEEEHNDEKLTEADHALEDEELQQVGHLEVKVHSTVIVELPALARLGHLVRQVVKEEDGRTDNQARMQEDVN